MCDEKEPLADRKLDARGGGIDPVDCACVGGVVQMRSVLRAQGIHAPDRYGAHGIFSSFRAARNHRDVWGIDSLITMSPFRLRSIVFESRSCRSSTLHTTMRVAARHVPFGIIGWDIFRGRSRRDVLHRNSAALPGSKRKSRGDGAITGPAY